MQRYEDEKKQNQGKKQITFETKRIGYQKLEVKSQKTAIYAKDKSSKMNVIGVSSQMTQVTIGAVPTTKI